MQLGCARRTQESNVVRSLSSSQQHASPVHVSLSLAFSMFPFFVMGSVVATTAHDLYLVIQTPRERLTLKYLIPDIPEKNSDSLDKFAVAVLPSLFQGLFSEKELTYS